MHSVVFMSCCQHVQAHGKCSAVRDAAVAEVRAVFEADRAEIIAARDREAQRVRTLRSAAAATAASPVVPAGPSVDMIQMQLNRTKQVGLGCQDVLF